MMDDMNCKVYRIDGQGRHWVVTNDGTVICSGRVVGEYHGQRAFAHLLELSGDDSTAYYRHLANREEKRERGRWRR